MMVSNNPAPVDEGSEVGDPAGDTAPPFRKEAWPFHWITRTSGRYFQVMEKTLKPLGLDIAQWRVLMCLDVVGGRSVSEIADICVIKLNTTTKIVQRLQADGLVVCRSARRDARVTEVRLSPDGLALQTRARAEAEVVFARAFSGLDPAEVAVADAVLERIFLRLGPP
jgi:MarR family transcriptional regulator, organic hydroperoxide resistance regulator